MRVHDLRLFVGATVNGVHGLEVGSERAQIDTSAGLLIMYHRQDCCEEVSIEDVVGDPADLIGNTIAVLEERTSTTEPPSAYSESWTWTFYELRTTGGDVTIRWLGESNGYYSEAVDCQWLPPDGFVLWAEGMGWDLREFDQAVKAIELWQQAALGGGHR